MVPILFACALAQTPDPKPADRQREIRKTMEVSVEKQKGAARKQIQQVRGLPDAAAPPIEKSWFTNPWPMEPIEPLGPPLPPSNEAKADCPAMTPEQVNPLIDAAARKEGVSADLVRAVMERESGFKPCAVSTKGAEGLMQLMPATAQEMGVADPFDPASSVNGGTKLLKRLMTKYKDNLDLILSAYNAGEARVDQDGGVPAIAETRQYVEAIRKRLAELQGSRLN